MQKEYRTVLDPATTEIIEKKSRFIASVRPIAEEQEALDFINEIKSRYWDANHNVYGYYLEGRNTIQRYSDDGEPQGTAGLPVLEVLKKMNIQDVVVVVTRYFGGTLLGAAGLIRAYGKCASEGVHASGIVIKKLCTEIKVLVEYGLLGKVQNTLINSGYIIKDIVYEHNVAFYVLIPVDLVEGFLKMITEITSASAGVELGEKLYITLDQQGNLIR